MVVVVQGTPKRAALFDVIGPYRGQCQGLRSGGALGMGQFVLALALDFSGVLPVVQDNGHAAGFGAGLFNAPASH